MSNTATIWLIIGICGFVLATIFLVISIVVFVKSHIPIIIGNLSGKTAARQIEQIRNSERRVSASHRPVVLNTGIQAVGQTNNPPRKPALFKTKATPAAAHQSKRLDETDKPTDVLDNSPLTTVLDSSPATDVLDSSPATDVLDSSPATDVLDSSPATTVLGSSDKTDYNATTVLNAASTPDKQKAFTFDITKEITCTHTDEIIK